MKKYSELAVARLARLLRFLTHAGGILTLTWTDTGSLFSTMIGTPLLWLGSHAKLLASGSKIVYVPTPIIRRVLLLNYHLTKKNVCDKEGV